MINKSFGLFTTRAG